MTFQNISALRALGGDVKRNVHFQRGKYAHMVGNISAYIKRFRAARSWGAMLRYFKRNFWGGDRDEKIDFRRITPRAP